MASAARSIVTTGMTGIVISGVGSDNSIEAIWGFLAIRRKASNHSDGAL
jgi:hypothetical protein